MLQVSSRVSPPPRPGSISTGSRLAKRGVNVHIYPAGLDHASRILKGLDSAGRSGCFQDRVFIGAGADRAYQIQDSAGTVSVQLLARGCAPSSGFLRKTLATLKWTRRVREYARALDPSCVNVHGLSTLSLGVGLKRRHGCRLVYDTHELETKALAVRGVRRLYSERLERSLIRHCDAVVCVSDGIADWYVEHYGIARPLVVRNVPDRRFQRVARQGVELRRLYGMPTGSLLFLYQGELGPGRQIETFLEVFSRLPPSHQLVLMGRGTMDDAVRNAALRFRNIHYHPAVPPRDLLSFAGQADVGLIGVANRCLSFYLSLPNKLFDCLGAGVPVIIPDFPEMCRIVQTYQCGWIWPGSSEALSKLVGGLSAEAIKAKREPAATAGRELTWENEEGDLLRLYQRLLKQG